jgi:hypothetical protein
MEERGDGDNMKMWYLPRNELLPLFDFGLKRFKYGYKNRVFPVINLVMLPAYHLFIRLFYPKYPNIFSKNVIITDVT